MAIGETAYVNRVREQLLAGRARLADVLAGAEKAHVQRLLQEVDQALQRIRDGSFAICEVCHDEIGEEWLRQNPLTTVCLEHMTPKQQRALEYDLEVAAQIQKGLLPPTDFVMPGWQISYHYEPAGLVSGDYCDLITDEHGQLHFILADVSGKGVAAAMLASNLRAIFRSLMASGLDSPDLMKRANRLFRQSALPSQYATLVFGRATQDGELEIVNAGHLPVLFATASTITVFDSTNPPLGVFDDQNFTAASARLKSRETLVLYTDGISEAESDGGDEFGIERLQRLIAEHCSHCPEQLVGICKKHLAAFRGTRERLDDEALLVMQFSPQSTAANNRPV